MLSLGNLKVVSSAAGRDRVLGNANRATELFFPCAGNATKCLQSISGKTNFIWENNFISEKTNFIWENKSHQGENKLWKQAIPFSLRICSVPCKNACYLPFPKICLKSWELKFWLWEVEVLVRRRPNLFSVKLICSPCKIPFKVSLFPHFENNQETVWAIFSFLNLLWEWKQFLLLPWVW